MWIKLDGENIILKVVDFSGSEAIVKIKADILNKWSKIDYCEGNIYIDGKKVDPNKEA